MIVEGQHLATVLKLAVKQHYGVDSEKLAELESSPFRGRRNTAEPPPTESHQAG